MTVNMHEIWCHISMPRGYAEGESRSGLLYAHVPVDAFGLERRGEPVVAALRARRQRCSIMPLCTFVSFSGVLKC